MKTRVGILGPYTKPDPVENTRTAIKVGMELREYGFNVFIPHLFMLAHMVEPRSYEFWMNWDMDEHELCDCFLRLPGESPGADEEVDWALNEGKTVFYSIKELLENPSG